MAPPAFDALKRFSDRVGDYAKYRPGYPPAVLGFLRDELGLLPSHVIADIGSGTGIFSRLLLENGNVVHAVEPNAPMRAVAEAALAGFAGFRSVDGTAEATTLAPGSVDFVTSAQAFHWFEPQRARAEFRRILRPGGKAVLVWNSRKTTGSEFLAEYERILGRYGTDYREVKNTYADQDKLQRGFFLDAPMRRFTCPNAQSVDYDGLRGRTMSASYVPKEGQPNHAPMIEALRAAFAAHQRQGRVVIEYETEVFCGELTPS